MKIGLHNQQPAPKSPQPSIDSLLQSQFQAIYEEAERQGNERVAGISLEVMTGEREYDYVGMAYLANDLSRADLTAPQRIATRATEIREQYKPAAPEADSPRSFLGRVAMGLVKGLARGGGFKSS